MQVIYLERGTRSISDSPDRNIQERYLYIPEKGMALQIGREGKFAHCRYSVETDAITLQEISAAAAGRQTLFQDGLVAYSGIKLLEGDSSAVEELIENIQTQERTRQEIADSLEKILG